MPVQRSTFGRFQSYQLIRGRLRRDRNTHTHLYTLWFMRSGGRSFTLNSSEEVSHCFNLDYIVLMEVLS